MQWCFKGTEMVFLTCSKFASPALGKLWFLAKEATESLRCGRFPIGGRKAIDKLPTRPLAVWIGILAEAERQKSSAVPEDTSTGPHTERTLSNTAEAKIAVPARRG